MRREILLWPDPRLAQRADDVPEITDEIRGIWTDMIDTMEAMPGVGLAAPQIGVSLRLAVVDASTERGQAIRMANPKLLEALGPPVKGTEASPNLPGISGQVARPESALVSYLNEAGETVEQRFDGLWARSVQHQIDHLNGMLFVDRLSRVKRDMLLRKIRKGR